MNGAKNVPEQTVQVPTTGEETYESEPAPLKPAAEVKRLQTELENTVKELEEAKKKAAILQEAQNIDDIPQMVGLKQRLWSWGPYCRRTFIPIIISFL